MQRKNIIKFDIKPEGLGFDNTLNYSFLIECYLGMLKHIRKTNSKKTLNCH